MRDATIFEATLAHGICEGMRIAAGGSELAVGPGYGYMSGQRVNGDWKLDLARQSGWGFVKVSDSLVLGAVCVQHGRIIAFRDMRQRLTVWRWHDGEGSLCYTPDRQEVVVRIQGAVQIAGLWEPAIAHCPLPPGKVLQPGNVYAADVSFDKQAGQASGMILETVGVMQ